MTEILRIIALVMVVLLAVMMLISATGPLWGPLWFRISQWWKTRNLRLCDYPDLHDEYGGLIGPLMDGLLDSDLYHSTERKAWQRQDAPKRMLLVSKLSRRLEEDIKKRYYRKGMKNAYARASRTLLRYERQRGYYGFDAEFDELYQKAKEVQKHNCLHCEDSGRTYGLYDSGMRTEIDCECRKKSIKMF